MPKYIDIHSHVNFNAFDEDRDVIIHRALDGDTWLINGGTQYDTSKKAVEMTQEYEEGVYASIGLHPIHTGASYHDADELGNEGKEFVSRGEVFDKEKYKELAKLGKVVAIGECGLDYYRCDEESIEKQKTAFTSQVELASELGLPLILHIRNNDNDKTHNAYTEVLNILKQFKETNSAPAEFVSLKGVIHFFAGTLEDAKNFIDFGFLISFTGAITYPKRSDGKGCNYEEIIKNIPIESIIADTDSPYVAPVPYRGKRNEPIYVKEIVKKIAEIKNLTEEETARIIFNNVKQTFDI